MISRNKILIAWITILLVNTPIILAQPDTLWTKTYGGSRGDVGWSVQQTFDGGYIVIGDTKSYGAGEYDIWLIKTDADGAEEWNKTFGGSNADWSTSGQQTSDGGYIILGGTKSYGAGEWNIWLIKTDADGAEEWNKTFGGSIDDLGISVQQTNDGGYIVLESTTAIEYCKSPVLLRKTNEFGKILWDKIFLIGYEPYGRFVQQTSDEGYIVIGQTGDCEFGGSDFFLLKTDTLGNELWTKTFGNSVCSEGRSGQQTSDGGYIIVGRGLSSYEQYYDVLLIKTNVSGNTLWTKTYGGGGDDFAQSIQQTVDGGYIITGSTTSSYAGGGMDVWLIKTDELGDTLWTKTYGGSPGDWQDDYG